VTIRQSRIPHGGWALALGVGLLGLAASATGAAPVKPAPPAAPAAAPPIAPVAAPAPPPPAYPSTYRPARSAPFAIVGANVFDGAGHLFEGGTVLVEDGKIRAAGRDIAVPAGWQVIDWRGKWVTPGVIDSHSHMGVFAAPGVQGHADGNENVDPNTAQVWAEHSLWPQDPSFDRAREGGVTSLLILPGSANLFGGRSVSVKNVPSATMQGMKIPDAPYGLKIACGENPKGRYGSRGRSRATRMGNMAGFRKAWIEATDYRNRWRAYRAKQANGQGSEAPKRDLALESQAGVLDGQIMLENHCYRADEMALMVDMGKEFGYRTTAFHHAVEAYKIRDILAREGICVATWAQRWGFKMEAYDAVEENAALLHQAGVCVAIHSDEAELAQRLNVEAAVALAAGRRHGIQISQAEAVSWFTSNAARVMGIAERTGSLAPGKDGDVVIWSANPFSIYALAEKVFIDGVLQYDRHDPRYQHQSDFERGQVVHAQ